MAFPGAKILSVPLDPRFRGEDRKKGGEDRKKGGEDRLGEFCLLKK